MTKIRQIIHPLTLAIILIYLQLNYFYPFLPLSTRFVAHSFIINAAILGIIFGLIGCPVCLVPLGLSLVVYQDKPGKTIIPAVIFNVFRLLSIFLYALGGSYIFNMFSKILPVRFMLALNGIIMIIFGIIVLKRVSCKPQGRIPNKIKTKRVFLLYGLWGLVLGFPCGIEATGFLAYLWGYPAQFSLKTAALLVFSFFSILPVIFIIFMLFLGIRRIIFIWNNFRIYLRNLAFFYLMLMGVIFIIT